MQDSNNGTHANVTIATPNPANYDLNTDSTGKTWIPICKWTGVTRTGGYPFGWAPNKSDPMRLILFEQISRNAASQPGGVSMWNTSPAALDQNNGRLYFARTDLETRIQAFTSAGLADVSGTPDHGNGSLDYVARNGATGRQCKRTHSRSSGSVKL